MKQLNELLQSEYAAMSELEISWNDKMESALQMIKGKITREELTEVEEKLTEGLIVNERVAFEEGFLRGIAVAKGGVV